MPVPYLENPPAVIPIDVGRQLFVDDFLIAETTMEQVFHKPDRYPGNPILMPDTEQKRTGIASIGLGHGGVFFNPDKGSFEMFYHEGHIKDSSLHMALSRDMVNWERPDLGLGYGNMILKPGGWKGVKRKTTG